jgi:hypothetical protein
MRYYFTLSKSSEDKTPSVEVDDLDGHVHIHFYDKESSAHTPYMSMDKEAATVLRDKLNEVLG